MELTRTGQFDQLSFYSTEESEEVQVTPTLCGHSPTSTVCLYTLGRTTPVTSYFGFIEDVYSNSDLMNRLRNLRGSLTTEPGPVPAPHSRMATRTTTVRAPPALDPNGERTLDEQISYRLGEDRTAGDTVQSWPMVVPGAPIYSQAAMRSRHTGAIPRPTSMQARLDEVNIHLPPPMVSVRVSRYCEDEGYPASQIRELRRDDHRFHPQVQSSLPSPRHSSSQGESSDMPSSVRDTHSEEKEDGNDREEEGALQNPVEKRKTHDSQPHLLMQQVLTLHYDIREFNARISRQGMSVDIPAAVAQI